MILECKVVFLFLCLFVTIRGHVQGDIETKIATLKKAVDDVKQFSGDELNEYAGDIQKIASNLLDLVNKAEKSGKVPTLTIAEMIYYQTFKSGVKGLEYYVELEAVKDGRSSQNVLSILAKFNKEQLSHEQLNRLFNFLEEMSLAIIKHQEKAEIEAFYNDVGLRNFMTATDDFKSKDLRNLCRKVLLKLMEEEGDIDNIADAFVHYNEIENSQDYANELLELWKNKVVNSPISKLFGHSVIELNGNDYKNVTFEKFWRSSIDGDVQLKVLDRIWMANRKKHEYFFKYFISTIAYSDKDLENMVKNSNLMFSSPKLKAMRLSHLLEKDPNDPLILDLAFDFDLQKDQNSYNLKKIYAELPENLICLINREKFCLISDGRFVYIEGNVSNSYLRVTEKNAKKPKSAFWYIIKDENLFYIKSYTLSFYDKYIAFSEDNNGPIISSDDSNEFTWIFNFTDLYTRAKIGNGEKYIKIKDNHLILDQTPTIWNIVKC